MDNSLKKGRITSHSNKIGLYDSHKQGFIAQSGDVVLSFPYKDCVLEGGMSDEESGREEKFFHETLDRADIDVLRDPKVLTKFEKIDANGIHTISNPDEVEFFDEDGNLRENLLIKGNNLIALYSLRQRLAGKVKLIYIDPPYNTGSDGFRYNDSFNHSTWLVFMRNRLEIARELLSDDGAVFVQCDDNEQAYLKVLMDEVFHRENFVNCIIPVMNPRGRQESSYPIAKSHEYVLVYSKIEGNATFYNVGIQKNDNNDSFRLLGLRKSGNASARADRPNMYFPIFYNSSKNEISTEQIDGFDIEILPIKTNDNSEGRWRWSKKNVESNKEFLVIKKNSKNIYDVYVKDYLVKDGETKGVKIQTFIKDTGIINDKANEHLQEMFKDKVFDYPKSEIFIKMLIDFSTQPGDIVLDYHLGSGTTAAVAHKMGRRWIGIEQMDYIEDIAKVRLQKVVEGEQGGISKSVDWKGGGNFVYMELKTYNIEYLERIEGATTKEELQKVYIDMAHNAFLQFWFDRRDFEREGYKSLSLEEQKIKLRELLDMNHLYLNALDMDDTRHRITPLERSLTTKFYGNQEI